MTGELTQEIHDRYEIEQVLRCYCRGVDRGDAALIRSVYHADATDDLAGNAARVETYFTAYHRVLEDDVTVLETFGGRYVDRFEKRLGQWKIADRVVVYEWSEIKQVPREYPNESFLHGQRSRNDLSYQPA